MAQAATVKDVRDFFDTPDRPMKLADMKAEWMTGGLTPKDKEQILQGLSDGTFTY